MSILYKLHSQVFIVGLLAMGFLAVLTPERAVCVMSAATLLAFVTQLTLLVYYSRVDEVSYTEKTLFFVTIVYTALMGSVLMGVSIYYDGDTFMLTKGDAWLYYTECMKVVERGFIKQAQYLTSEYEFEDWGALFLDSTLLYLVPDKLIVNFVNMLTSGFSALMLFRIGRAFMPPSHAFLAALAYSTSSFLITFHCTFLKEPMFVFLIICAMYFFYKAIVGGNYWSYLHTLLFLVLVATYRPAVSAFLVMGFVSYFAITQRGTAISFFLYVIIALMLVVSMATIQGMSDRYTGGGDIDGMAERGTVENYSSGFSYFVSLFAGPFGPFPTVYPKEEGAPATLNFYGPGLLYRLFLVVPFWMGVCYAVRRRAAALAPMLVFIIVEMLATAVVLASLELRKVLMHIPFMYIIMFYGLHQWEQSRLSAGLRHYSELSWYAMALSVLVLWNIIR